MHADKASTRPLRFFASTPYPCNYLPQRMAVSVYADPQVPPDTTLYSFLVDRGFRRSGALLYRPHCPGCDACIPIRIPVAQFRPNRSQRRAVSRNRDLQVRCTPPTFKPEHFALYRRYLALRHPGGGMDDPRPEDYMNFLSCAGLDTGFYEFRERDRLLAVSVVDHLTTGLSAVYTFYEPMAEMRSVGTYTILWQIAEAQRRRLTWLYLGYWISECRKMSYKSRFQPFEMYRNGRWIPAPSTREGP